MVSQSMVIKWAKSKCGDNSLNDVYRSFLTQAFVATIYNNRDALTELACNGHDGFANMNSKQLLSAIVEFSRTQGYKSCDEGCFEQFDFSY